MLKLCVSGQMPAPQSEAQSVQRDPIQELFPKSVKNVVFVCNTLQALGRGCTAKQRGGFVGLCP